MNKQQALDKIRIVCAQARNPETICEALHLAYRRLRTRRNKPARVIYEIDLHPPGVDYPSWASATLPATSEKYWREEWERFLTYHAAEIARRLSEAAGESPGAQPDSAS